MVVWSIKESNLFVSKVPQLKILEFDVELKTKKEVWGKFPYVSLRVSNEGPVTAEDCACHMAFGKNKLFVAKEHFGIPKKGEFKESFEVYPLLSDSEKVRLSLRCKNGNPISKTINFKYTSPYFKMYELKPTGN